jgi:hypothetical protein
MPMEFKDHVKHLKVPTGRKCVVRATIMPNLGIPPQTLPADRPGMIHGGGQVLAGDATGKTAIQDTCQYVATWNTGEEKGLYETANATHAERQLINFLADHAVTSINIEITLSPCPPCADQLIKWIGKQKGPVVAVLEWKRLYVSERLGQGTVGDTLNRLHAAGWKLAAPRSEIPEGTHVPVILR